MRLYDSPPKSAIEETDDLSKLPPAQRKKLKQKQKKAEARAKKVIV
jgi:N-alpha-acetyltransferase 15/16, NatA auxiliary subunit